MSGVDRNLVAPVEARVEPKRENAFGFLRIAFALMVMYQHSFPLGGFGYDPLGVWSRGQTAAGELGVLGFFAISGYLVTISAQQNGIVRFAWHRGLRILPAFWVMLLITVFVVSPIVWLSEHHAITGFFASPYGPFAFVGNNMFLHIGQWSVRDVFLDTPYGIKTHGGYVNGSIVTLIYEWHAYVLLGIFAVVGVIRRWRWIVVLTAIVLFVLNAIEFLHPLAVSGKIPDLDAAALLFTSVFLMGSLVALYRIQIDDRAGVASLVALLAAIFIGGFRFVGLPLLVYVTLWAAHRIPAPLRLIGSRNDYSYGTYIYGFLVLQILAWFGVERLGWPVYVVTSCVVSVLAGAASWHIIERPALAFKSWTPPISPDVLRRVPLSQVLQQSAKDGIADREMESKLST